MISSFTTRTFDLTPQMKGLVFFRFNIEKGLLTSIAVSPRPRGAIVYWEVMITKGAMGMILSVAQHVNEWVAANWKRTTANWMS